MTTSTSNRNKRKIVNDPVYGFINIPFPLLYDLMEHPWFQRLRRIRQLGLTNMVYPGANHTRFQHALGAMHLMDEALRNLRAKGVDISDDEMEAALIAILLHDIGHGPFSHTSEGTITDIRHEEISLLFMKRLDREFGGRLAAAMSIFRKNHPKSFLCQLVSGQLDMDRMDYLRRDSFFTGVTEGIIGSDRIIKMLNVVDGRLVVEAKGIYSIEKFLLARRLMFWQVYLHKTVIAADRLLVGILLRAKDLLNVGKDLPCSPALLYFLKQHSLKTLSDAELDLFALLDDSDIEMAVKQWSRSDDAVLARLSTNMLHRVLARMEIQNSPFEAARIEELRHRVACRYGYSPAEAAFFVHSGTLTNHAYSTTSPEESILVMHNGRPVDIAEASDLENLFGMSKLVEKYFLCYPKDC